MKVWFFYIKFPSDKLKEVPMFRLMFSDTIETQHIQHPDVQFSDYGDYLEGMYAWTDDEVLAKKFKHSRHPAYFALRTMDIDEDSEEWVALNSTFHKCKLLSVGFTDDDGKSYSLPRIKVEDDVLEDESAVMLEIIMQRNHDDDTKRDDNFSLIMNIFKDGVNKLLDKLGYTEMVMEYGMGDALVSLAGYGDYKDDYDMGELVTDIYQEQASYSQGFSGELVLERNLNPVNAYIYMLGGLLV